ncbi:WASH complex subunit 3-like [Penaeus japonicus]|uniref:WASH complex subunit 3-like n=1 Tax=Penaeus japonicus TaxID=27405 RepID=UPI001C7143AA|nr:WASH complex subunit 3-like [Penaeus japonicus]
MDRNSVVTPNVDLSKVEAINQKRTLAFINHWVLHTVAFLNQFSSICEERLVSLDTKLRRADHSLAILEAKLSSVPGLEGVVAETVPAAAEPASSADAVGAAGERHAADGAPGPPPAPQPVAQQDAVDSPQADPAPPAAAPAVSATPVSKDPRYAAYFKMLAVGVPRQAVELKMSQEGIDPSLLDDPDAPAPPGDTGDSDSDSSSVSSWSD